MVLTLIAGLSVGFAVNVAFGIFRIHEGTWLCGYLLCIQ